MSFFADVIAFMGLSPASQQGGGIIYTICAVAVATGATGTYTGNPMTALRLAIVNASNGERPTEFQGDAERALVAAENRWAATH